MYSFVVIVVLLIVNDGGDTLVRVHSHRRPATPSCLKLKSDLLVLTVLLCSAMIVAC